MATGASNHLKLISSPTTLLASTVATSRALVISVIPSELVKQMHNYGSRGLQLLHWNPTLTDVYESVNG